MRRKGLEFDLQMKVRNYLEYSFFGSANEFAEREDFLIHSLASNLKEEVLRGTNGVILDKIHCLRKFSSKTLTKLLFKMKQLQFSPEEIIFSVCPKKFF